MDYVNAGQGVSPNDWHPVSGLGGYIAGQGQANYQSMFDRGMRDSDLGFMEKLNNYEMQKAQNPAQLSEFDQRKNKADTENKLFKTGLPFDVAQSGAITQLEKNITTGGEERQKQRLTQMQSLYDLSQELKQSPVNPGMPQSQDDVDKWNDIKTRYKKDLPSLPDYPTASQLQMMDTAGQRAYNTPEFQHKLATIGAETSGKVQVADIEQAGAGQRTAAVVAGEQQRAEMHPGQALESARQKMSAGTASPQDVAMVKQDFVQHTMTAIMSSLPMKMATMDAKDQQALVQNISSTFDGIYSAAAGKPNQQPQGQTFTNPQEAAKSAVGKPDGYKVIINGKSYHKQGKQLVPD